MRFPGMYRLNTLNLSDEVPSCFDIGVAMSQSYDRISTAERLRKKLNEIESNISIALYEDYRICESEYDRQSVEGTVVHIREQIKRCRNTINKNLL